MNNSSEHPPQQAEPNMGWDDFFNGLSTSVCSPLSPNTFNAMLSEFNTECHSQPAALSGLGIEYQSQPAAAPETPRNDPPTPPVLSENQELQQQIQKLKTEVFLLKSENQELQQQIQKLETDTGKELEKYVAELIPWTKEVIEGFRKLGVEPQSATLSLASLHACILLTNHDELVHDEEFDGKSPHNHGLSFSLSPAELISMPVWMAVEGESDAPLAYAEYFNILRTIPLPELDSQQLDFLLLCCLVPGSIPLQDINISRLKAESLKPGRRSRRAQAEASGSETRPQSITRPSIKSLPLHELIQQVGVLGNITPAAKMTLDDSILRTMLQRPNEVREPDSPQIVGRSNRLACLHLI
ncbi:uncharacterized protein BDCG_07530 [Blastomyces dermatitidis ER-3]|uniref:DUF5660 domain-containing protein n=1 Tax=Ajellomyces dermatitidis (strain ER-3 / ATCC MYA-2586) TaxID=559297 RepID=A0ABP2F7M6_AJEDR|nr:uncharacterized protein BDCG_07530 [Blastomyces dermatitidis ER-3]EEQ92410.2 hypothetical protein BDCG_07530 [Blastomyces dermatitidis ER-3]